MTTFQTAWIMGLLTGTLFGVMLTLTVVHWRHWRETRPKPVVLDDYTERLRKLDGATLRFPSELPEGASWLRRIS